MKRRILSVCLVVLLFCVSFGVCAAGTTQHITLTSFGDAVMLSATDAPAEWESPSLLAGEALRTAGELILTNDSNTERTISLDYVALPYDNDAALDYLNYVNITVREGTRVLYDGPYSRINDNGNKLILHYALQPKTAVTLSIDLRCDYAFCGTKTGFEDGELIDWKFYTVLESETEDKSEAFSDPALRDILAAAGVAILLLIGVGIYEIVRRKQH